MSAAHIQEFIDPIPKPMDITRLLLALTVFAVLFAQPNGLYLYFPDYPLVVSALIVALCFFAIVNKPLLGKWYLPRVPICLPLSLFFVWSIFSLIYAPHWIFGLRILLSMITKVVIFGLIIEFYDRYQHLNLLLGIISTTGAIFSFQAIAQFISIGILGVQPLGGFSDSTLLGEVTKNVAIDNYGILGIARSYFLIGSHRFTRAHGIFTEPGWFANFLEFSIFATLALFALRKNHKPVIISIMLLLQIGALFMTFSTAGWLAAGLGGLVYVYLISQKKMIFKVIKLSALLLLFVISASLLVPRISSSIYKVMWTEKFKIAWGNASLPGRLNAFEKGLNLIQQSPIWGHGTSQTRIITQGAGANNSLLTAFVELGLIGGIIYLWILGTILKTIWSNWRMSKSLGQPHFIKMTAALTGGFTALLAHSMLLDTNWTFFYWIGVALLYVDFRILSSATKSSALGAP